MAKSLIVEKAEWIVGGIKECESLERYVLLSVKAKQMESRKTSAAAHCKQIVSGNW